MTKAKDDQAPKRKGGITGKGFVAGDPRINRSGRPKSFDQLKREAIKLACEVVVDPATGEDVSVARLILERWAESKDWQAQRTFMEYAYGRVPIPTEISGPGRGPIAVTAVNYGDAIAILAPGPMEDSEQSGEHIDSMRRPTLGKDADGG